MSRRSSAFFKSALACAAGSASCLTLALASATVLAAGSDQDAGRGGALKWRRPGAPPLVPEPAATPAADPTLESLPTRTLRVSDRGGQPLRVGDTVSYELLGGDRDAESRWAIDPVQGSLKLGILFRPGKLITPLRAGEWQLPALIVNDENGKPVAKTEPLQLSVQSNLPPPKEGAPAEPPKPEPAVGPVSLGYPAWVQTAIALSILTLAIVVGWLVLRAIRRRAARALKSLLPKKPYDVASLDRLDDLLRQGLVEKKAFKPFYFGISETLKFYLGHRFDFDARESTTSELFALLRDRAGAPGLGEGLITRLERLFESLDPVKFADVVPTEGEARAAHREAVEIVRSTRKVEPVLPAKEAAR
jgi:hypothetical protein